MPINFNSRSRLWLFLALPFGLYALFTVVVGGAYVLAVMGGNYMDDQTLYCDSPAEARAAGVFLDTVVVEPRVVRYGPYEVVFENCYVEQLRESHRESWHSRRVVTKKPRAMFTLAFRATRNNQPITNSNDSPVLTCEQGGGGIYLGQETRQYLSIYADILTDGSLGIELPLELCLDYGVKNAQKMCFSAKPANCKK